MHTLHRDKGFTLVEIMVVIVIIGLLAAAVAPKVFDRIDQARITKVKQDVQALEGALELYKADNYNYPDTDQGLEALLTAPEDAPAWKNGGYIKRLEKDPWQRPYLYLNPGENGEIDIYSYGEDGRPGGTGMNADIGNWNLGK